MHCALSVTQFPSSAQLTPELLKSRADLISNKTQGYFLEEVFSNKSENYRIYERGLKQSQFSISVQGIIKETNQPETNTFFLQVQNGTI